VLPTPQRRARTSSFVRKGISRNSLHLHGDELVVSDENTLRDVHSLTGVSMNQLLFGDHQLVGT
jgi:hypothetical protein